MYGIYENGAVIGQFAAPLTMKSNQPIFASDTLSLKRSLSQRSPQRWEIETNIVPLSTSAQDLMVNLVTKGYSGTVDVLVPQNYGVIVARGDMSKTHTASVTDANAVGDGIITVNTTKMIPKGTFIRFGNTGHTKVYMTTADVAIGSSSSMLIYPLLRQSTGIGVVVSVADNVHMDCLFDTDVVRGMVYQDGILMNPGIIKLLEKL